MNVHSSNVDSALQLINRELWIITAASGDRRGGLLATWVSTASIDRQRPALLAGLGPNHFSTELVQTSRAFAAHLLRPNQIELAWNFAKGSGRQRDKLAGLVVATGASGSPLLADCLAWFDCQVFAQYDAGDRLLVWADVLAAEMTVNQETTAGPLREQEFFAGLSSEQRQILASDRLADATQNRNRNERWRQQFS